MVTNKKPTKRTKTQSRSTSEKVGNYKKDFEVISSFAAQIVAEHALIGDTEMAPAQRDPVAISGRMKDKAHNIEVICGKYLSGTTIGDTDVDTGQTGQVGGGE
ncbi:MAG: hypothetical protein AABN95_16020 [Acidobacteriota bacterium]